MYSFKKPIPACWKWGLIFFLFLNNGKPSKAQSPAAQRPVEMWAFRSVLDGVPRVLTLALHQNLYVGYDTYYCGLTKIWKDGVLKVGPVYNQKHGPQPISKGGKFFDLPLKQASWSYVSMLSSDSRPKPCKAQFKGYRFEKGKIALKYALEMDSLHKAELEEWPEYVEGNSGPILERYFVWIKPPSSDMMVFSEIATSSLGSQEAIQHNSDFRIQSRTENLEQSKPSWSISGHLRIKPESPTWIKIALDPNLL